MTERLYYDDPLLTEFDAVVVCTKAHGDGYWIALDRSAFYPTSGGQPHDNGVLRTDEAACQVTDVIVDDDGEVWHDTTAALLPGTRVHGVIDWERRRDHMEQHGGEHMIAGAIWTLMKGVTIGLHCGAEDATIDVTLPDGRTRMTEQEIAAIEALVNREIREDAKVRCWFPTEEELPGIPLRKPPAVKEHVRVVAYGDYEYCACGGTHPPSAGWIGCVKILSVLPERGKARVRFVCGERAFRVFAVSYAQCRLVSDALSCPADRLDLGLAAVEQKLAAQADRIRDLSAALCHAVEREAEQAVASFGGTEMMVMRFPEVEHGLLAQAASEAMEKHPGRVILCLSAQRQFVLAAVNAPISMAALAKAAGLRGGGKPDFAQGKVPDDIADAAGRIGALLEAGQQIQGR
ncbi:MAG: hypothetical protein IJ174_06360 [Clostridia bacterium]|nr:hypothetical protein [Clostridia bacterium]